MAVTRSCVLFPDSKSPAAGKMLTPPEARSGRSKCPSALEAWRKNPCKHNPKSSAAVTEAIVASPQILQRILCMDPACPVSPVSCLCPEPAASHFPRCLHHSYLPSPVPEASCRLSCQRGDFGNIGGAFSCAQGCVSRAPGCPFLWAPSPGMAAGAAAAAPPAP